ncbi:maleylpyruvate isomerase family mycothiol-dependent enzyme [Micromonospora sp. Llam7]|uniref:maleylpyruvate isomerase family mycothiol-dependent enzyme n=1 Tax=Micromonospora tarapacensis TaxID=2835305 RepID=UPI001C83123F|nr:maleylpyruvate isomerase family mycothiol-dependent enzyme [Micromonospora tarapacensis]MBX7265494.1 maleylpyruvate isomerase family mycothiol-dependent enzyme [Micromonospora tarapacensis]
MAASTVVIDQVPPLRRQEAAILAAEENQRFVDCVRALGPADWDRPTDCPTWPVRDVAAHVLGMWEFTSSAREFVHVQLGARKAARGRPVIDGMTEVQVSDRAHLTPTQLVERLATMAPRGARSRRRLPAPLRRLPIKLEFDGTTEPSRLGHLFDVILTRDAWMHRVDIARASGQPLILTADHDGRIVADVTAEWARRHGQPFRLRLDGPAGGRYTAGDGGEEISLDAVEFCRILSGRDAGTGLLTQQVPF